MKIFMIALILVLNVLAGIGQEMNRKNMLSISFGEGHIARQDLLFSPFVHTDLSFMNAGLEYTRESVLFQNLQLRYANFTPMISEQYNFTVHGEPATAYPHYFTLVNLDYLLGKDIGTASKTVVKVGGLLMADVQALNYVYGRFGSFGYYAALGLGAFATKELTVDEKNKFSFTLKLPLLAWLARSPFLVNDDEFIENISSHSGVKTFLAFIEDGKLATWNNWQSFDFEAGYAYQFHPKWELGAAYLFEFIHSSKPRNLISYRNSFNFSISYKF